MRRIIFVYLILFLFTGVFYPLLITGVGTVLFKKQASGSFLLTDKWSGSLLIGQKFVSDHYFWPRPSAVDYDANNSGGSNLGPLNLTLKEKVEERRRLYSSDPPPELLYASASGLDPHISPKAAHFQASRVAKARGLPLEKIQAYIDETTTPKTFGFMGQPTVNVLRLNILLDQENE